MAGVGVAPPPAPASSRVMSIDVVRGLVMVIMPLEHARELFAPVPLPDPVDLSTASAGLFLTRLLTHLCAPTFVFLAGLAAGLRGQRMAPAELSRWLVIRGIWLVLLEITVVNFSWTFSVAYPRWFLQVIWALGMSMIALAGLVRLPVRVMLAIGIAIVAGHNLLDGIRLTAESPLYIPWAILHQRDLFEIAGKTVRTSYPVLPWIGVMALGYCAGPFYAREWNSIHRRRLFELIGATLLTAFIALRLLNVYGDASPFEASADPLRTVFSLFNTTKYPPSLVFVLMTLGVMFLCLASAERAHNGLTRMLAVYGRAPLFFYVAHWYVLHLLALAAAVWMGVSMSDFDFARNFAGLPEPLNFPLCGVYVVAGVTVALLYLPCRWLGDLKRRSRAVWLGFV